ncbi:protein of unknown function DUF164 [Desulfofarcimen acetoxidans DSM 771]|uniref:C4-type zinc ribbon domain-containing protein n=1 Tax=Desulfofarcimen acetoxidans (strain ATCC 49208 / DSM 771 / KCTC 5769 / VKM B-1644 / 5575) TaxID=485916 RepID=C8W3J9_DESAS|nr:C4-type zinc ribbon domain-containing protein [Desulfofarcimen acetoxidans]ACV63785.1 protein of unknown function DUF164 [Desulfofarcimen acetoxidans DSM 771]
MTLQALWKIQELDMELVLLENQLNKDPVTDRLRELKELIINIQQELTIMKDDFDARKKEGNYLERKLFQLSSDLKVSDEKLYAEGNSDYKELSVQMEKLEELKRSFIQTEDIYLQQLEEKDRVKLEYKNLKQELFSLQEEFKSLHKEWQGKRYKLKARIKELVAQKLVLVKNVEEPLWLKFMGLKKKYPNPLSIVNNGICSGCHIGLSSGDAQKIKSEVILCSFCGRILCPEDSFDTRIV